MNVLMSVAVLGAVGIRQWTEAATVVFLFSLSELLEALSVARARKAIGEVLTITPETATLIDSRGKHSEIATESIVIGSLILVKSGERIPMDGVVKNGTSYVNQAALTGESAPVEKKVGDNVFAGTINESSVLEILVSSSSENSKVAQIIRMVEEAQGQKAPSERFVDSFAKIYTPAVFVLAILTLAVPPLAFHQEWSVWFYKALVLLVVACPCALVISTPVSIVSALTALARKGVLVKGGAFLEILGKVRAIAVDKTGTITEGTPTVHQVILIGDATEQNVVQVAASVEKLSSHPLAVAVVRYSEGLSIPLKPATDFKNILGKGAEAKIEGHEYFLGNHRFAHELGVCTPELEKQLAGLEEKSLSVIVVGHRPHSGCKGEVLGILAVGDVIRKDAKQAVQELRDAGIESMIMLSGDNQRTATAIASSAGISEAIGDLLPEGKVSEMKRLVQKYGVVAMIGDGINDAPALAEASVGIAMGGIGTDTAIETADVALMRDDLKQVVVAIKQGRRALSVIRFNIGFAILLKAAFLVLTFLGFANLWLAVGADTGASLLVIFNSLRLLRIKAYTFVPHNSQVYVFSNC
ncbi:MAG: heavy metal translocating P-type ATPase [Bacteriovoracia bacterium]